MIADTPEAYAAQIAADPDFYTVVRFRGRGRYDREEHPTFEEAQASANGDRRAMIYAVKAGKETLLNDQGAPANDYREGKEARKAAAAKARAK